MTEETPAVRVLLTTVATAADAEHMATVLVGEQLAACVNIIPGVRSVYRWQGKMEAAEECFLLLKTDESHRAALESRLKQLHPYDLPELLVLAPYGGSSEYLDWITRCLSSRPG